MLPSNFDFIDILVEDFEKDLSNAKELYKKINDTNPNVLGFISYNGSSSIYSFVHSKGDVEITNRVLSYYWYEVYKRSNLDVVISSDAQKKIQKQILEDVLSLPYFDRSSIENVLIGWGDNANKMFSEKVDSIFRKLSGTHVTNKPHGFTKKFIYKNLFGDYFSVSQYGLDIIHDLRTSIQTLFKLPISSKSDTDTILKCIKHRNEYLDVDGGAFRIKAFYNGNAHIEVHNHVATLLNCELAKLYPNVIAPKYLVKDKEIKEYEFKYNHLDTSVKYKLYELIRQVFSKNVYMGDGKYKFKDYRLSSFNLDGEIKEILNYLNVEITYLEEEINFGRYDRRMTQVGEIIVDFDLKGSLEYIINNGICDYKSNQYYPTPKEICEDIYENVLTDSKDKGVDFKSLKVLEPSAGRGNIAKYFKHTELHCIEKDGLNAYILQDTVEKTIVGDFLFYNISKKDSYDYIVMNPPYNKKQWKSHVEHALKMIKLDGKVYAVLPSGKKDIDFDPIINVNSTVVKKVKVKLLNEYKNAFDNTAITTALYEITLV